jgi:cytochrome P450 family 110
MDSLPPGPSTSAFWQTYLWAVRPWELLDECQAQFGELYTLNFLGLGKMVMVASSEGLAEVFRADPDHLVGGAGNDLLIPFVGRTSILTLDGPEHRRQRKLLMPAFHGRRMSAYGDIVREATLRATAEWSPGDTRVVHPMAQQVSLEVILRAVFGVGSDEGYEPAVFELLEAVTPGVLFFPFLQYNMGPWSPYGRFLKAESVLNEMLFAEIGRRREAERGEDILSMLIDAVDDDGQTMTDGELRDELVTLLMAGHETTATAIAWAMQWILRDPDLVSDLRAELDGIDEPAAMAKAPLLRSACREALRLVPVIPIAGRTVKERPFMLLGRELPPETRVMPAIYNTHRRSDLYAEPAEYRPRRFIERRYGPFEFIPFGGGGRRCIGGAFAEFEMAITVGTLLTQFDLSLEAESGIRRRTVTLSPSDGTRVRVEARDA